MTKKKIIFCIDVKKIKITTCKIIMRVIISMRKKIVLRENICIWGLSNELMKK